ncbi:MULTISPECIES: DUF2730 family protein [Acinetobacter]|uniref:DUF2730 family protein n=1 Tax=Acinetobacter ursingii TaxID=108980 RepID=A0A7T9UHB0_9GAMM|nr:MULTISPECIES: DUF2730 family protein [Acinetobacter]ENX48779.1 hypothetical protein F943_02316 [Acinetobacter ursingii NIPH 706]EXD37920.1 hypothetical protein J500_0381 [Acinetobacter sp. 479375]MCH2014684.1 DUF2730 family protein [Acinetobacter ursingii]MCU4587426.1 DUF2730 family protein [Acinetobacter ursingii]QQT85805.1 DUF2730 family protein [Acinetobacter ursingii]
MFDFLKLGFAEVQWIVVTALGIYAWIIQKHSASAKEMLDLHLRVIALENSMKDMPTRVDISNLQGQLNTVNSKLGGVEQGVKRIEDYLLNNNK